MIENLREYFHTDIVHGSYSENNFSLIEDVGEMRKKIIECINSFNNLDSETSKQLTYLLNEGLDNKVLEKLYNMIDTGEMATLVNDRVFKSILAETYTALIELKNVKAQLNEKMSLDGTIGVNQIDLNKGKISKNMLADDVLQAIAGTGTIEGTVADASITTEKLAFKTCVAKPSKNLFNKEDITTGKYVKASDGKTIAMAGYNFSNYIDVHAHSDITISGTTEQGAYYKEDKTFISGFTRANNQTKPVEAYYLRVTIKDEQLDKVQVEGGTEATNYSSFEPKLSQDQIENLDVQGDILKALSKVEKIQYVDISVKQDGTGDFTSPYLATDSIKDSCYNKRYRVYIYDGIYDILTYLPSDMIINASNGYGKRGWEIPDYVDIIGVGDVEIKGEQAEGTVNTQITALSTINLAKTSGLYNLKVTAKNMRYCVHDESNNTYKNWERHVENCTFIHYGNDAGTWASTNAYGQGLSEGSKSYFKNCKFISTGVGVPWSTHDKETIKSNPYIEHENCEFIHLQGGNCVRCGSLKNSLRKKPVIFNNCKFVGRVFCKEEISGSKVGINFEVKGAGNTKTTYGCQSADGVDYFLNFSDEYITCIAGATINKGDALKQTSVGIVSKMEKNDNNILFYGVALNSAEEGEEVKIKIAGYISLSDAGLVMGTVGSKVGVINGKLEVIQLDSVNYNGIIELEGWIKLR